MKKFIFMLLAILATVNVKAQSIEVYNDGGILEKTFTNTQNVHYKVVFKQATSTVPNHTYVSGVSSDEVSLLLNGSSIKLPVNSDGNWQVDLTYRDIFTAEGMFGGNVNLSYIDLGGLNGRQIVSTADMFRNCFSLEYISMTNFITPVVENMTYMFANCESLKTLDVSHLSTSRVKRMGGLFRNCKSLEAIDLSNWDMQNIQYIDEMFSGCESIKTIDLSGWILPDNLVFDHMFEGCKSLKTIYMINCAPGTINFIKEVLNRAGLSNVTVVERL